MCQLTSRRPPSPHACHRATHPIPPFTGGLRGGGLPTTCSVAGTLRVPFAAVPIATRHRGPISRLSKNSPPPLARTVTTLHWQVPSCSPAHRAPNSLALWKRAGVRAPPSLAARQRGGHANRPPLPNRYPEVDPEKLLRCSPNLLKYRPPETANSPASGHTCSNPIPQKTLESPCNSPYLLNSSVIAQRLATPSPFARGPG
jgi:hypothetical protein